MKRDVRVEVVPITDLQPDPSNANTGTERGLGMLEESLQQLGAGRSVLADRHGVLMAGNKTHQRAVELGFTDAVVVHTDGRQLVVVQRDDLDLETDPRARRMAISDNRVGEIDLQWSPEMLAAIAKEQPEAVEGLWTEQEMAQLLLPPNDPAAEWQGMPEFEQEDKLGGSAYQLIVHFKTLEDRAAFGELIGQSLTEQTKYLWYPERKHENRQSYRWADES